MHSKTVFFILQSIVIVIPASLIFYYALNSGFLPDNDYWGFISHIISEQKGFSTNLYDWIQRDNEHYIFLPKLVYALNILLTGGNNIALSLFAWLMGLGLVLVLRQIIPVSSNQHPWLFTALLFIIAIFVFSPKQAHNWILGMSGVAWISANLFSISALLMLFRYHRTGKKLDFDLIIFLSLCAVATYSTSLALLPTLIIATVLLKFNGRDQLFISLFAISLLFFYYNAYSTPSEHPTLQRSFTDLIYYFFAFIGALFTEKLQIALIAGIFGLASSLAMMIYSFFKKPYLWGRLLPWFLIQIYVCGNAAMTAIARSGFGLEQVFASRYGSLPALFWLGWIVVAFMLCWQLKANFRKISLSILFIVSLAIILTMHLIGYNTAKPLLERAKQKSLTAVSLYAEAYDLNLIYNTLLPEASFALMERLTRILKANQHIPFNGHFKGCPKIGDLFIHKPPLTITQQYGNFDSLKLRNNSVIEVKGWAYNNNQVPNCIVITNEKNRVRGIARYGLNRADVIKSTPAVLSNNTGWQGYARVHPKDKNLKAYMLTAEKHSILLGGEQKVGNLFRDLFKDCPKKGSQLNSIRPAIDKKYFGRFDRLKVHSNNAIEVRGWAYNNNQKPSCLVVANQDKIVKAIIGTYGFTRADVPKVMPSVLSTEIGWQGYGKIDKHDKILQVYMLTDNKKDWVLLGGEHLVNQ